MTLRYCYPNMMYSKLNILFNIVTKQTLVIYNQNIIKQVFQRSDPTRGIKNKKKLTDCIHNMKISLMNFKYEFQLHKLIGLRTRHLRHKRKIHLTLWYSNQLHLLESFPNHYLMLEHTDSDRVPFVFGQQQKSLVQCELPTSSSHMTG